MMRLLAIALLATLPSLGVAQTTPSPAATPPAAPPALDPAWKVPEVIASWG